MSMTTDDHERISCAGKVRFTDWRIAQRTARRQTKRHRQYFMAYQCQHCPFIHVGSNAHNQQVKLFKQRRRELEEHEHDDD